MNSTNATLAIVLAVAGAAIMAAAVAGLSTAANASTDHHDNSTSISDNNSTNVSVGKGNLTVSYNQFYPQEMQISAGESVTFTNPTPELHSVIFDLSNGTIISDIILPFTMSSDPQLELQPPFNLGEPIVETDENGTQVLITLNKVVFVPAVVDGSGNTQSLNGTDISYTMTGDEQVISSGIMMPTDEELEAMFMAAFPEEMMMEEQAAGNATAATETEEEMYEPVLPNVNNFTVTFEEPGTYEYFCPFHPAMYGTITVN